MGSGRPPAAPMVRRLHPDLWSRWNQHGINEVDHTVCSKNVGGDHFRPVDTDTAREFDADSAALERRDWRSVESSGKHLTVGDVVEQHVGQRWGIGQECVQRACGERSERGVRWREHRERTRAGQRTVELGEP